MLPLEEIDKNLQVHMYQNQLGILLYQVELLELYILDWLTHTYKDFPKYRPFFQAECTIHWPIFVF